MKEDIENDKKILWGAIEKVNDEIIFSDDLATLIHFFSHLDSSDI